MDPSRAAALLGGNTGGPVAESTVTGAWDAALGRATAVYERRMYYFFCDNCHCYVAQFLNDVGSPATRA